MIRIIERQIVRTISGPLRTGEDTWRIRSNAELDPLMNGIHIVRIITVRMIRRLGHIQIMDSSTIVKESYD